MSRKPPIRYALRKEPDETWMVFDIFTGLAYCAGHSVAMGMQQEFAERLVYLRNQEYKQRLRL